MSRVKQSEILTGLIQAEGVELFHTCERNCFTSFQIDNHTETWPIRSKSASSSMPKCFLDSRKPRIEKAMELLEQIDGRTVVSLDKNIEKTITALTKLTADPILKNAFDSNYHVYESARNLDLFRRRLVRLCRFKHCLHAVVNFIHGDFLMAFFASHAYQVLRNKNLFAEAVQENQGNESKRRGLNTYEAHFIVGMLEEALFGHHLGELAPYVDQCPAVKKQIQRWATSHKKTYRLPNELQSGLASIPR